jgi:hypothetical protein
VLYNKGRMYEDNGRPSVRLVNLSNLSALDIPARLAALKDSIRSDVPVKDAAAAIAAHAADVAGAAADTDTVVVTLADLQLVALDSRRPVELRSAASSLLAGGKARELMGAEGQLTEAALAKLAAG